MPPDYHCGLRWPRLTSKKRSWGSLVRFCTGSGSRVLKDWRSMLRLQGRAAAIFYALPSWGAAVLRPYRLRSSKRLSKCGGRPLGLCGERLPEFDLVPIQVIDPGKATVGFIHSFGVNLYSLLF